VIRALNADVPWDQFVREHLAGDLLPKPRRHAELGFNESIIATGFWYLCEDKHAPVDVKLEEALRIDNQIDVFGKAFLGLTIACARCHDHKFDAITTKITMHCRVFCRVHGGELSGWIPAIEFSRWCMISISSVCRLTV